MYSRNSVNSDLRIKNLVGNLKILFSNPKPSLESIPSLYFTNKILEQRTIHLKLMKLLSKNNSQELKKQYLTNPIYNFMIRDLTTLFEHLEIGEKNDYLSWYRWSLSSGCTGIIPAPEFTAMKAYIQSLPFSPHHLPSIKSTFMFNLASLGLENEFIIDSLLKTKENFKLNEIKTIFHSMSLSSSFNDTGLLQFLSLKLNQSLNMKFPVSDYLETIDFYCLYCDLNQIEPDKQVMESFSNRLSEFFTKTPWKLVELSKYKGKVYLNKHLSHFYEQYFEYFKRNLNNPVACFNLFGFVGKGSGAGSGWVRSYYDRLKFHVCDGSDDNITFKSKIVMQMSQFKGVDEDLADLCVKSVRPLNEFPVVFIRNWIYYHEITGKCLVKRLKLDVGVEEIEKLCKDLDAIHLSSLFCNMINYPCKKEYSDLVKKWIVEEIVERSKKDIAVARYCYVLVSMSFKLYKHEELGKLLKGIEGSLGEEDFFLKINKYPKIVKNF